MCQLPDVPAQPLANLGFNQMGKRVDFTKLLVQTDGADFDDFVHESAAFDTVYVIPFEIHNDVLHHPSDLSCLIYHLYATEQRVILAAAGFLR